PAVEPRAALPCDGEARSGVGKMPAPPSAPPPAPPPGGPKKARAPRAGAGPPRPRHVFADRLLFANGLMPWRGGVLVTAAPHIVHLRDTDGDGKADQREVLYEGFAALNPQLRVSHPILGIDNWVYVSNGLRGGQAKRRGRAGKP